MSERTDALHILTNNSGNYNKLHGDIPIGESSKSDLYNYFILLFKNEYRYNYYNWQQFTQKGDDNIPNKDNYCNIEDFKYTENIKRYIEGELGNNSAISRIEIPDNILNFNINSIRDDSYRTGKLPYISVANNHFIPDITTNDNYQEKAIIASDLNKLNNMFKNSNYKDIDDLVLLDFYKEFKDKIDVLKSRIISDDIALKCEVRKEIIEKLKIIYRVNEKKKNELTTLWSPPLIKVDNSSSSIDGPISEAIINRATRNVNLNIFSDYNKKTGGGWNDDIGSIATSIVENIEKIKKKNKELNKLDISILSNFYNIIKNNAQSSFVLPNLNDIQHTNNTTGITDTILDTENMKTTKGVINIITNSNTKKYIKYLLLINYFSSKPKKTGGALVPASPYLRPFQQPQPQYPPQLQPQYPPQLQPQYPPQLQQQYPQQESNAQLLENEKIYLDIYKEFKKLYIKIIDLYIECYKVSSDDDKKINRLKQYKDTEINNYEPLEYYNSLLLQPVDNNFDTNSYKNIRDSHRKFQEYLKNLSLLINKLKKYSINNDIITELTGIERKLKLENIESNIVVRELELFKYDYSNLYKEYTDAIKKHQDRRFFNKDTDLDIKTLELNSKLENIGKLNEFYKFIFYKPPKDGNFINTDISPLYIILQYLKKITNNENNENNKNNIDIIRRNNNSDDYTQEEEEYIYEKLWKNYMKGINTNIEPLAYIEEGEKLKTNIILNDLDPEIILKVDIRDKAIFLLLIFMIRTISVFIIELLIEYNIIKSLPSSIIAYTLLYLSMLLLFIIFINLDSYKLRIIFNYLNMHANTSNVTIHLVLFSIFAFLVIIIIQTDNFINNVGDIFDYTYIYNLLFDFSFGKMFDGEFENNISPDEKIKLLYRLDIITMLIFIFTGTIVLLI